uniref:CPBP family intramembrane glutamic endopeptidase n=1 Tax=Methylogaea oryzae TaxID=1295382 RepID=UPI0012E32CDC
PAAGVGQALLVGVLVGCIEELLFRGVLLGALAQRRGAVYAVAVSAFYYAILHFFHSDLKLPEDGLGWQSSFTYIGDGFRHLLRWNNADSFAALYCAGLLLGCARLLVGPGLALCIGIHAGWVYTLRTTLALTDLVPASPLGFLVGDYDHIIGWLAAGWLTLLTLPLLRTLHRRRPA